MTNHIDYLLLELQKESEERRELADMMFDGDETAAAILLELMITEDEVVSLQTIYKHVATQLPLTYYELTLAPLTKVLYAYIWSRKTMPSPEGLPDSNAQVRHHTSLTKASIAYLSMLYGIHK